MSNPIRTTTIAGALSLLVGALLLGCPGGGNSSSGTAGNGGGGNGGGDVGGGGSGGGNPTCEDGETQTCYSGPAGTQGMGECKGGKQTCSGGAWGQCEGEVLPTNETCDGADNDCNGQVDDGIASISCGQGICSTTVDGCVDGKVPTCEPGNPAEETCDGVDNDCDGKIDEGMCPCDTEGATQDCYSGNPALLGVGVCKAGTQTCTGGTWGACENEVLPSAEVCDSQDNDCDASTDENIAKVSCGVGACLNSVEGCVDGQVPTCTPGMPKTEVCNNIDDDCNLFIDDGFPLTTCGVGECQVSVESCVNGMQQTCTPKQPGTEICDGKDNDCDGQIDEGNPGGGAACNNGTGACSAGTFVCSNGMLICQPTNTGSPEKCNGIDDDCDGQTDEGNPEGGAACDVAGKFGPCKAGTTTCNMGVLSCAQVNFPQTETCDAIDNNCNGATDEGLNGQPCDVPGKQGVCKQGSSSCSNGSLLCTQVNQPTTELCNGLDDNCNGTADESNPEGGASCTVMGQLGVCASGSQVCTNGSLVCTQTVTSTPDVCGDNKDNDCDGQTDEGQHSVCDSGVAMSATACTGNPCVGAVCTYNNNSFATCCTGAWSLGCTLVADFVCGAGTCCSHNVCTTGGPLVSGCSACVTAVCQAIPSCCTTAWDAACKAQTATTCNITCS